MSDILIKLSEIEHWRDGNGKMGAAATIADHEKRLTTAEGKISTIRSKISTCDIHRAQEKLIMQEAIEEVLSKRAQSAEGIIRAFGPYFASVCSIVIAVITYLLT